MIVVDNRHSDQVLQEPLEGEWKKWVLVVGIVGDMNWWWCSDGTGNIGSLGHMGECRNSRVGKSDQKVVEFEIEIEMGQKMKKKKKLLGNQKRSNPSVSDHKIEIVLCKDVWGFDD